MTSKRSFVSCIKIGGTPIIPPLMTPKIREECLEYKMKAVELERKLQRNRIFKQYEEDLEKLKNQTKDLSNHHAMLENQLAMNDDTLLSSHVPYKNFNKLQNLTKETIDVSEYSDDGVKLINNQYETQVKTTPHKLIRSNSYTLESPSPILLAHLEKEARKCVEMDDNESQCSTPATIIDSEVEPPLQVIETDVTVQQITVTTPVKTPESNHIVLEPQLLDILNKLPENHAKTIVDILTKQQTQHTTIAEQLVDEDRPVSVSISSQSIYYSMLSSPDTTHESPNDLNVVNLRNVRNKAVLSKERAASIIGAVVKGYLVRRLLRTEKVQSLIETIKDALMCAVQIQGAEFIDEADVELHRRLIQQLTAACYAFHDVFFALTKKEQMGIIALDRQRRIEKANRPLSSAGSTVSSRKSSARISR